jgi:hypothetical protein
MKNGIIFVLAVMLLALIPAALPAQTQADEEEMIRSQLQTGKKAIIADNMQFTEAESQAFWPVYNEFQQAKMKINAKTIKLINDYLANYEKMTDEKAGAIVKDLVALEKERADLKASFLPRFSKVLPAKKVARYYQLENKIEAIVKYELAKEVPLLK